MTLKKRDYFALILIFIICFGIYWNWTSGARLLSTFWLALKPFLLGAALAYIVNIVMSFYEGLFKRFITIPWLLAIKRAISMIFAYLTFVVVIAWIFSIVIPDLIASIQHLIQIDTSLMDQIVSELNQSQLTSQLLTVFGENTSLSETLSRYTEQFLQHILLFLTNLLTSVSSIAATLINLFISFVFSIYVLANKERLAYQGNLLLTTYLKKWAKKIHYVLDILHDAFYHFFVGETIEALILGSLTAIGMFLLGFPYAATVGILVALTAFIPIIGAYIGATVGFILIATQSLSQAFWFLVFLTLLQQFEGNVIYPRVVGKSIGLPGMWVLLAITLGGALAGVFGMLVAVPIAATCYQLLKNDVYQRK